MLLSSHCSQLDVGSKFCVALLLSARVYSDTRQTNRTQRISVTTSVMIRQSQVSLYHATRIQTEICGSLVIMLI